VPIFFLICKSPLWRYYGWSGKPARSAVAAGCLSKDEELDRGLVRSRRPVSA